MVKYRDVSIPYTEQEITDVLEACKKFKTFEAETDSFSVDEMKTLCEELEFERSAEQIQAFEDYWNKHMGGRFPLKSVDGIMRVQHRPSLHAGWYAGVCDTNKDGFISKEEFDQVYALMSVQWPKVAGKSYEDFVHEADTDNSGTVSIDEFVHWLAQGSN